MSPFAYAFVVIEAAAGALSIDTSHLVLVILLAVLIGRAVNVGLADSVSLMLAYFALEEAAFLRCAVSVSHTQATIVGSFYAFTKRIREVVVAIGS